MIKEFQIGILGVTIALGMIFSTGVLTAGVIKYQKLQNQTITVTGSASQNVTSDFAVLNLSYRTQGKTLKEGYEKMNLSKEKIKNFLVNKGINEKDIDFGQVSNYEVNKRVGNSYSNEVDFYKLDGSVKVLMKSIDTSEEIARSVGTLVNQGVEIGYSNIEYFVSNLDEIKIKMVGDATKNAKERAKSMVKATGDKIGSMNSARMGVFQVVPLNSTDVTDSGINDTTSVQKKVVAVVNATFTVK